MPTGCCEWGLEQQKLGFCMMPLMAAGRNWMILDKIYGWELPKLIKRKRGHGQLHASAYANLQLGQGQRRGGAAPQGLCWQFKAKRLCPGPCLLLKLPHPYLCDPKI